jgi:cyclohexanone monooxygenase
MPQVAPTNSFATPRAPLADREVDVAIVGAGFSGMYLVERLRALGFSMQGFEAGDDVGGTWYWNRYPGARCDVPSLFYSYNWSPEVREDWKWSEKYAAQPEILEYAKHVASRYDLRAPFLFQTRVTSAHFDDASGRWTVRTDRGDVVRARFCVMATGCLSVPRDPDIAGSDDFAGPIYHTGRWPHEGVDFTGLRVGIIGTGSSSIQSIPVIAAQAAHLYVFQRTPNFSVPAQNAPLSEAEIDAFRAGYAEYRRMVLTAVTGIAAGDATTANLTPEAQRARFEALWQYGGAGFLGSLPDLLTNPESNEAACQFIREKILATVHDRETALALLPDDHPVGSKRICVDIGYYETFNQPHVELVNLRKAPIERITATGVRTAAADYELDAIVFATGFDAMTGALLNIDIARDAADGSTALTLKDAWRDGPRTYLGLAEHGLPNLFTVTGPGSPSVLSNMLNSIEQHVEWITGCMDYMRSHGFARIEAEQDAQDTWVEHVNEVADRTLFPRANSWYIGANVPGKPRVFMPYIGPGYRQRCEKVAANGYEGFALR